MADAGKHNLKCSLLLFLKEVENTVPCTWNPKEWSNLALVHPQHQEWHLPFKAYQLLPTFQMWF